MIKKFALIAATVLTLGGAAIATTGTASAQWAHGNGGGQDDFWRHRRHGQDYNMGHGGGGFGYRHGYGHGGGYGLGFFPPIIAPPVYDAPGCYRVRGWHRTRYGMVYGRYWRCP